MTSMKIKLAVDRSRNRVLFAEAGSDFVDVLLSFLTLPLSALQFCAAGTSPLGCLSNLCDSVSRLGDGKLLKVETCHGMPLTPLHYHEFRCRTTQVCCHRNTFIQNQPNLQVDGEICKCWEVMARLVHVYALQVDGNHGKFCHVASSASGPFVRCKERFVISDDWTIMPASTSSIQSLIHKFSFDAVFHGFEEVEVSVNWAEVVSMLKASLSSDTIFTDVFLLKGTDDPAARVTVKPSTNQKILITLDDDSCSLSQSKIKLFYDRKEKKVMYAECKHEFVDLLLGFLTYPLGCVIKNVTEGATNSHLGSSSFDNLYISAVNLDAAGFLTGSHPKDTFLNPPLSPFSRRRECSTLKEDVVEPENYMGLVSYSSCGCCRRDLVEERNYVVDDDLLMHQASVMSVTKHWCRRDKANVVEMDIFIRKQEVVLLLRAMLTSKTALTDVFISRLEEEHSSLEKMQISVEFPTGKTITVEVARFDTIATVKSRIKDKVRVPIPAGLRHELVYGSKYLEDSCTVAGYNLVSGCTIAFEFRLE